MPRLDGRAECAHISGLSANRVILGYPASATVEGVWGMGNIRGTPESDQLWELGKMNDAWLAGLSHDSPATAVDTWKAMAKSEVIIHYY